MREPPPGFRLYMPVLDRLADYRTAGTGKVHFRCPFAERHKHRDENWSGVARIGRKGQLLATCNGCGAKWTDIAGFCGLPLSAFFIPDPGRAATWRKRVQGKIVAEYPYHDAAGNLVAVKQRWEPKSFTWKRPLPDDLRTLIDIREDCFAWVHSLTAGQYCGWQCKDGTWDFRKAQGQAVPLLTLDATAVGLYRLPELIASTVAVFVVEGEGKADLLAKLGYVAVSGPDGSSRWEYGWGEHFRGRGVIVIPDPDKVGMEWASKVIGSAIGHGCKSVRQVEIPRQDVPDGGDVKEWLAARPAPKDFRALVTGCPMYQIQGTA